jgi:hypothetical protein
LVGALTFIPSMKNWFWSTPEPNADTSMLGPAGEVGETPGAIFTQS